jgi:CDP-2,3-bis-(O-geranylgeranyl)-sn-glycerol synthase
MIEFILSVAYLALPAYLANTAPVLFARAGLLRSLNHPVDGGKRWGVRRLFGTHKTWRGLVSGAIVGFIVVAFQAWLYQFPTFRELSYIDYPQHLIVFGLLAGSSALLGDLAKSFFKRRYGIASGDPWPVIDQLDFIIGFLVCTYPLVQPSLSVVVTMLLITLIVHPLTNILGYFLHLKKVWW